MWCIRTVEYSPAIERNEVLTHSTTRMYPENITLSERSRTQKQVNVYQ